MSLLFYSQSKMQVAKPQVATLHLKIYFIVMRIRVTPIPPINYRAPADLPQHRSAPDPSALPSRA